jgi:hypothetical protein
MHKPIKHFVVVAMVLGILALVANMLVDNPYTHRLIRTALNRGVEEETNLVFDFKAIKVSVVPPGVDLYGVQLAPKSAPHAALFSSAQVKVRLSLWALVMGDIRIGLIEAQEPAVYWPPPWDFPGFLKNEEQAKSPKNEHVAWPPNFPLPVDRIVLSQARVALSVNLEDSPPKALNYLDATIEGLDVDFKWRSWEKMDAEIKATSINLSLGPTSYVEETSLEASLSLRGNELIWHDVKTIGERLSLSDGEGALRIVKNPGQMSIDHLVIDTHTKVDGDLSLLGTFLDIADTYGRIQGDTQAEITIPITSKKEPSFKIKGSAKAKDARLYNYRLFDSLVQFEVNPDAITFPDIAIVIGETKYAKGQGTLHFDDTLSFEWNVKPDKLRLYDLLDSLGVTFDYVDAALLADDLKIAGQGDPFLLKVSAHAQLSDIVLPATPYDHRGFPVPPQCLVDLRMVIDENNLGFDGTSGVCFQTKDNISTYPPKALMTPPTDATAISPITLTGGVHFTNGMNLTIRSQALDLAIGQHFATVPMTGQANVVTDIRGPFDRVQILSRVQAEGVSILQMPLGHVQGQTLVEADRLLWKDVRILPEKSDQGITSDGQLDFDDALTVKYHLKAQDIKRQDLEAVLHAATGDAKVSFGIERLEGDLSGPLLSPFAMEGRLDININEIMQGDETLADHLHAKIDAKNKGISTDDLRIKLGSLTAEGRIAHTRSRPFGPADGESESLLSALGILPEDHVEASIKTVSTSSEGQSKGRLKQDVRANHLSSLPYIKNVLAEAGIKGAINLRAKISGHIGSDFQGTFDGGVSQFELLGSRLAPIGLSGFIKNSRLDMTFSHSGNALEGRMSTDFKASGIPYEWYFTMRRLDMRALASRYFYDDPRNYLYLTGDWHMQGKFADFWRSTGEFEIKGIRAKYVRDLTGQTKTLMLTQEKPVTLRFAKDGWTFDKDEILRLSGRYVNVAVSMARDSLPEHLGIHIDGTVDMAMAKELSQDVDTAEGQIQLNANIGGAITDPSLKVDIADLKPTPFTAGNWRPVTFGLAAMRPAMRNIKLNAQYAKGRLAIASFLADKGGGTISATGSLGLTEEADEGSRLDVTLSDASLIYTVAFLRSFETQVSGNLSLSGRGVPYKIGGGINITKARSTKEVDIRGEIINVLRQKSFSAQIVQEKPTILFDLKIVADQTINVHNHNLQTVLSTNISLQGTDIAPQILGQVEVNKGRFIYKRDFQILRGLVIFDDPVKPDPSLDILAASDVDNYRVYIAITGRASNPTVEFSIDPPVRESGTPISKLEILVLLSRGKLPEENRSLGQETQNAAASEAANLILGQFEEPVEKLFDLSGQNVVRNVYIDTHPSPDGGPVPRLNLPLDIGENFDIILRADGQTNEVSTEYNIHDNINFSGVLQQRRADDRNQQTGQRGVDGEAKVNLKFRFSFE